MSERFLLRVGKVGRSLRSGAGMSQCSVDQQPGRQPDGSGRRNKSQCPKGYRGVGTWAGGSMGKTQVPNVGDQPGTTVADQSPGKRGVQIEVREGACALGLSKQSPEIINQMRTKQ